MVLYHGSNIEIKHPSLNFSRTSLDFGAGFYTTSVFAQAEKWAKRVTSIRKSGEPVVSVFEISDPIFQTLNVLRFNSADRDWLELVVQYRTDQMPELNPDIIVGPVANDRTVDVINQYIAGTYPIDIALQLLLPMQFKDQWTFKTERALNALVWKDGLFL